MDFNECYQDTCSTIALAARHGKIRQVQRLLTKGYSVDVKDNRGWNALHEAALSGSAECVRLLLGAAGTCHDYVNSLTHNAETPLYVAAQNGHVRAAKWLIKASADLNLKTNDLSCPLFAAVDGGHKDMVELLVRSGAEVNGTHSASGWSCLHQAVYKGHSAIVQCLVRMCTLEAVDDYGITPVFVAAQYGHQECLRILAKAGANVNCQAKDLATPLLIAAQEGHLACVELLLAHSADPNLYCNVDQWQLPIHAAAQFCHLGVLERLLAVTRRECDHAEGKVSPVYLAVLGGHAGSLRALLSAGYSPNAQSCRQFGYECPLDMALCMDSDHHKSQELAQALLRGGASVSLAAFGLALQGQVPEQLPLLLEHAGLPRGPALAALLHTALDELPSAHHWLPLLLKAGIDPTLLLQPKMLEEAEDGVLSYFLEFVNWSTLPSTLLHILSRRREEGAWRPRKHLEVVPSLAHLCRLAVRKTVGSDAFAKPAVVHKLPIPSLLQDFLLFSDITSSYSHLYHSNRPAS